MLTGKNIILKLVQESDLDLLYKKISDLSNRGEFFPMTLSPQSAFKKQYYENGFWNESFGRFLIRDKEEVLIGSIYYFKTVIYSDALELGYILFNDKERGKGYTTQALSLMVDYLFKTKTMNRIQLRIDANNTPSIKVALKCGFHFDGTRKQIIYLNGKHQDLDEYAILREEWQLLNSGAGERQ